MHFAALFSRKPDAVPVLFMHGWPGSHLEYLSMMDLFRKRYSPEELPYHIINATIPGYTLSSGPPLDKPFGTEDIARVINKMMIGLGFGDGYVSQGGDVGSFVSKVLAGMYDECKAIHRKSPSHRYQYGVAPLMIDLPQSTSPSATNHLRTPTTRKWPKARTTS